MEKAAIYCRLSEEDRSKKNKTDDNGSIRNQKTILLEYAAQHSWEVYNIYSDDNYTGSDRNRPAFTRMLEDAESHRFDIILCKSQSRFTRELELVEKYINGLFPLWGIRFISLVDNADTSNKGNKKARQINGLVNEWYLEDMSENIRAVLTSRRKNGLHIGAFAPYGYKKDPEQKGHLLVDEEAAAVVREVFILFSQGYGKAAIARLLRRYGLSQQQAAEKLGRSQSAVANKLRLLRLEEPVAEALHRYGLTERHARALLRLEDPEQRLAAVEHIGKNQLNVADAEAYIDRLVTQNQTTPIRRRSTYILKDVRLFLNSVDRGVRLMQTAGVGAKVARRDTEDAICLTVTIPRAKPQKDVS